MTKQQHAACVFIPGQSLATQGRYLIVSRPKAPNAIGLPGGKVDPGERFHEAALREVQEEVGLTLLPQSHLGNPSIEQFLIPVHTAVCPGGADGKAYLTSAYVYTGPYVESSIQPEEGLQFRWATRAELCDPACSPFASYNAAAFAAMDAYLEHCTDFAQCVWTSAADKLPEAGRSVQVFLKHSASVHFEMSRLIHNGLSWRFQIGDHELDSNWTVFSWKYD